MPTLEEVKEQIGNLDGMSKFLGRKEIKELPNILWKDEKIEKIVQGVYEKNLGILVASDKRIIFIDKGLLYGLRVEDFPYNKVTSIQYKTGLLLGEITIFASGNKAVIGNVNKKLARIFSDHVRIKMSEKDQKPTEDSSSKNGRDGDIVTELEKLANLKEKNILTEEEFLDQKKKILSR